MTKVFVAGSISIKRLDPAFMAKLDRIVAENFEVVVGDADGADSSIQKALLDLNASNVTVYCSGDIPRNNFGHWPVRQVDTNAEPGTRAYFTAKDQEMAREADYGLMLWDAKSTGTLSNVFELAERERVTRVFVNKAKKFLTVRGRTDIEQLVSLMSEGSRRKAEQKIGLSRRLAKLGTKQFALAI
jgi:hypothetical protein